MLFPLYEKPKSKEEQTWHLKKILFELRINN